MMELIRQKYNLLKIIKQSIILDWSISRMKNKRVFEQIQLKKLIDVKNNELNLFDIKTYYFFLSNNKVVFYFYSKSFLLSTFKIHFLSKYFHYLLIIYIIRNLEICLSLVFFIRISIKIKRLQIDQKEDMFFNDPSQTLFSFTQTSSFQFFYNGLMKITIRPIDQKIKQINIIVQVKTELQTIVYEELLEYSDFFKISKSNKKQNLILNDSKHNENNDSKNNRQKTKSNNVDFESENNSLLWIKLYIEDYFRKIQLKVKQNKSQRQLENIFNSFFILSNEIYIRKVYKNTNKILKNLQGQKNDSSQKDNKTLFFKIDPSILNYPNEIFEQPFFINLPRKIKKEQNIISIVQINQKKKQLAQKNLENIFFDNKFI